MENTHIHREPEKGTVFDWRAKLKEEEKDNDPKNMWKKFDSAGPMKVRSILDVIVGFFSTHYVRFEPPHQ